MIGNRYRLLEAASQRRTRRRVWSIDVVASPYEDHVVAVRAFFWGGVHQDFVAWFDPDEVRVERLVPVEFDSWPPQPEPR